MSDQIVFTCKFGGSSVATGERVAKVAELIKSDPRRRFVVVSAPGKSPTQATKVTDLLYAAHENKRLGLDSREALDTALRPLEWIARDLNQWEPFHTYVKDLRDVMRTTDVSMDFVASRGEYLMARLLALYLDWPFIDAKDIVWFTSQGVFNAEQTNQLAGEVLRKHTHAVIPGFYGSLPEGGIKTFSRGGSDLTGAIIARATHSVRYENWTDVDGFMSADPRIVPRARPVAAVTYRELRELSYMGAKVFHEEAVAPAVRDQIPIHILNTFKPEEPGTRIMHEAHRDEHPLVVGVAGRKGFSSLQVRKLGMNEERGFLRRLLTVLADEELDVEHVPGGIDSLSVIVPTEQLRSREDRIKKEIEHYCRTDAIDVDHGLALIATVGHGMWNKPGVAARLTGALAKAKVNIKMINQGSSELNIIVGVDEADYEPAIRAIHDEFFP